ncbi:hypothetical protein BSCG_03726 [Bacteroides sp. 2_2_4]|nr:hypothetical protein BSCG_03726 [Bacteroides sp. 2_2_4]
MLNCYNFAAKSFLFDRIRREIQYSQFNKRKR